MNRNCQRLQAILQNYKPELKLYKFLLESSETIEDAKKLPVKLKQIGECITGILDMVHTIEGGRYKNSEFSAKKQSFNELFQQLDIMYTKEERMKQQPQWLDYSSKYITPPLGQNWLRN